MNAQELADQAKQVLEEGRPEEARKLLLKAVEAPDARPEHVHALASVQLRIGEPETARALVEETLRRSSGLEPDETRARYALTHAAACADMDDPISALSSFKQALAWKHDCPEALLGVGFLQIAMGELDPGIVALERFVASEAPSSVRDGAREYLESLGAFRVSGRHPRVFLERHQQRYTAFFNAMAQQQEARGWIAEAARMGRSSDGSLTLLVPEGARPYAAVRVDLVDPATGQGGLIGEQPMLATLKGFEALGRAPALLTWPDLPFDLRVSTQTPWDQLPIQVMFQEAESLSVLDPIIGEWYHAGFEGAFGTRSGGRFHYISDPDPVRAGALLYHLDLGRADMRAIDDLILRLSTLNQQHRIRRVVLGRGHLPG